MLYECIARQVFYTMHRFDPPVNASRKERTFAERCTLETYVCIDLKKGNIRECEMMRTEKEGNYSRMRDMQFAPQPATIT